MISKPAYPGERPLSQSITDELLAYEAHMVNEDAERGYGLDGMPLQRGQSPLSRPREPKNQGGG